MRYLVLLLVLLLHVTAQADVVLPRIWGHHMVLQREKPVFVWGQASPGEVVTVRFADQNEQTTADASGHWKLSLKPLAASSQPRDLTIQGRNTIVLKDVLVGEVWLCSGQSNMEFTMRKNSKVKPWKAVGEWPDPVNELEGADNPEIRIFLVNRKTLPKPDSTHAGWSMAKDSALRSFSAPAYFFAKKLQQELGVPVGVIASSVPGSRIEPWIAERAFQENAYFRNQKIEGEPGKFYEPMIRPLALLTLRGFLWYQGESNCFLNETESYTQKMKTLIDSWRKAFGAQDLPFYYVQLAPFTYSESKGNKAPLTKASLPEFREAQEKILQLPHTGMIITTDLADSLTDIHPPYKWEIGRRLALVALHETYQKKDVAYTGPIFQKLKKKKGTLQLYFEHAEGLMSQDGKPLRDFEIAGKDQVFVPAQAEIQGNTVVVSAPQVKNPEAVRFGWYERAQPNLFNQAGLPARPFRTRRP
ncbi:sialate O-acetylesterase [Siphonobacter sp. BAB-5405]|uniref:sialate O-acetylesterase n=1 Tax=Siphonobacter sp. BAB-5405 TaxID=1864825 RepID=UPI000C7F7ABF|nr:sialate O-acetylesterase [Siphonobacter sp. BAB-5405]PMD93753.1 sialate O-acetylesterase [Siphonobacter sp. BAB-5405]